VTTAEAIEGITNAGEFEILATRVLRITEEDCRLLDHMGVNAVGKTVANPIDGFCKVPGTDPPRFLMAAFTTDRAESLERKWLFDHSTAPRAKKATAADDGDLVKAHLRAQVLLIDHTGATFTVHLCTNKQPDDQLMAKVLKRGVELGLDVRFLTRSCLRDILDVNPDGQWLRKEHLGIEADRLSFSLLRELSAKSLQLYGREFLITPPETFVSTAVARCLEASLAASRSIYVVTGTSGSGKSVSCYQILCNHLAHGGVGLWIPGELAARATSLEEAIGLTLRSLHPMIEPTAAAVALRLGRAAQRFILVIDDINRGSIPAESLRKLLAWSRPTADGKNRPLSPCAILVPAWDLYWAPLDVQFRSANWLVRIPVNKMGEEEAQACLAAAQGSPLQKLSDADQRQIVAALAFDPILIALYASAIVDHLEISTPTLAIDVIKQFVEMAECEAVTSTGYLQSDYDRALTHLAATLLSQRVLYPRWEDVQQWLPDYEVKAIRELARLGKVCRVTNRDGEDRFEFRHDRILEHFLVYALMRMLSEIEANADVLSDPFYASFVGQALAICCPSYDLLEFVRQHAPLALISSLRFLPVLHGDTTDRIVAAAKDWLESASKDRKTPSALLFEAYRLLEGTDTPNLLIVTQSLSHHRLLARGRLANGDASAGVVEFSDHRWFAPAVTDRGLDAVLSRAIHRHKSKLIADCTALLQRGDITDTDRRGALVLAGFIADVALAVPIRTAWDLSVDKSSVLQSALWAGLRCAANSPPRILDGMLAQWAALPDEDEGKGISERDSIAEELRFAIPRGIPESVLGYLIAKSRVDELLRRAIVFMLERVDHPLVVAFLIEVAAETERHMKETKGFSPWLVMQRDQWDPTRDDRGKRLSTESMQEMRYCWESKTADPQLRETAFNFWVTAVDDLDVLRSIPSDHPQYKIVLRRRAKLGDKSAVTHIKPLLASDKHWFYFIGKIWTEQFKDMLDDALMNLGKKTSPDFTGGITNDHYMLAQLLRDIPANQSQQLLVTHWDHLKFSPKFVQAALYIGTTECIVLATKVIGEFPSNVDPFEHIDNFFGFFTTNLMDRLAISHLEVLLPFLGRLSDHALVDMAAFCDGRGHRDWGRLYLKPEFDSRRARLPHAIKEQPEYIERLGRRYFPSDDDLLEELDWVEQQGEHYQGHLYHWSEEFERRQDEHTRWQRILTKWFSHKTTIDRFRIVANAILEHGTRTDIYLLNAYVISGGPSEIDQLRANASFGVRRRSLR